MNRLFFFITTTLMFFLPGCFNDWNPGCGYGPRGSWGHMMNYGYGYGGIFMWLLLLIIIGIAVYFFMQTMKLKGTSDSYHETPLEILKKRYARGEISKEEFDRIKNDL